MNSIIIEYYIILTFIIIILYNRILSIWFCYWIYQMWMLFWSLIKLNIKNMQIDNCVHLHTYKILQNDKTIDSANNRFPLIK